MDYSYRGFDIELNTTNDEPTSKGLWGYEVFGADHRSLWGEVDKYITSGDAGNAALQSVDKYLLWMQPMSEVAIQAVRLQEELKNIEDELLRISETPYYRELFKDRRLHGVIHLNNAYLIVVDVRKVNEEAINIMRTYPHDDLATAIDKYQQALSAASEYDEDN